ncbi:hypothetical protein HYS84_02595 [Candidatus Saccharibacteria bacterium]|nr:hypothetical protein [Candidatus Saccharibacteria bacterium]
MLPDQQNQPIVNDSTQKTPSIIGTKFRRLLLLAGLLLPPLGLVAVIYLIVRAIKSKQPTFYRLAAALVVVTLIGALVYLKIYNVYFVAQLHKYSYSTLEDYKLPSKLQGAAVSFKKPAELKLLDKKETQGLASAYFVHTVSKGDSEFGLTYMAMSSLQSALAASDSYVTSLGQILKDPNNKDYQNMADSFKKFLQAFTPKQLKIEMQALVPLTTTNIKQNAWQANFRAGETAGKYADLKGKFVFAVGKRTFYYFMVATADYNWQRNQDVWQQVIDSLKIDQ